LALLSGGKKSDEETKSGSQETVEEKEENREKVICSGGIIVGCKLTQGWYGVFFLVGVRSLSYLVCF